MRLVSRLLLIMLSFLSLDTVTAHSFADKTGHGTEMVSFNYAQEELVNVITFLSEKKGVNVLLPTKEEDKVTGKLTWKLDEKVTIDHAWNLLQTILSIAGYSLVPYPTHYEVKKTQQTLSRQPVPLYIGVPYDELPETNQYIRYMYYLSNIKTEEEGENEALTVLKDYLPPVSQGTLLKLDAASNSLIIGAPARDIRAIMPIIASLDRPGFQEKMEVISLQHTQAKTIADLFNNKILQSNDLNRYRLDTKKTPEPTFFSKHLKIIANERRNDLIVLGRPQAIDRTRYFITNYLDISQETGKSILHTYRLQYLNAKEFAEVLRKVLLQKEAGGFEQAEGRRQQAIGPQRYFDEVIIAADTPDTEATASTFETEGEQEAYYGGNTLIIAARNDDWKRLQQLIAKLDQPAPQVLIEVLITDLTLDDAKALGASLRNPAKIPLAGSTAYQSAHLDPGIMPKTFEENVPDNTIGTITDNSGNVTSSADLLRTFGTTEDEPPRRVDDGTDSIAARLTPGTTAISFNDNETGRTWGIADILKKIDHTKVLSHPHVIATSGKKAQITIEEIRKVAGNISGSSGSQPVRTQDNLTAALKVEITPRIALAEQQENAVNLQVMIDINQFVSASSDTRTTRNVTTNVTMNTGDMLSLGGLIRATERDIERETPLLSKIPVIGWFFKNRQKDKERTNLTVFISPTVILPRQRNDMQEYTKDYLNLARSIAKEANMFDSLKDPITRWFFKSKSATEEFSEEFIKNDIHFQDTPMPGEPQQPTKQKATKGSMVAHATEHEENQLKELFKDVDNPFKELQSDTVALNEMEHQTAEKAVPRRKRRKR